MRSDYSILKLTVTAVAILLTALCGTFSVARAQETATDLPMWFDVAATTPPNIKLNTDNTVQLQNEESVAVDPTNPNNLVAVWRDFRLGYRQVGWGYSHDGGTTWTEGGLVPATPYNRDSDPVITVNNSGMFYGMILSYDEYSPANGLFVPVSLDSGLSWPMYLTAVDHPPEFFTDIFEDKEWIVCDQTGGPTDGNLYVPWTRFTDTTGIFCVASTDGMSFSEPRPVSDRGNVQWPVGAVGADGRVVVAWVSFARNAILFDISYDQGLTWSTDQVLQPTLFQDGDINGGIRTFSFPALTGDMTQSPYRGRLYCVFEDQAADGLLDLYLTMSLDSGMTWTPRVRINDDPLGNHIDQFHPWISVNPDGVVSVAFYDRRLDPANLLFDLWVTHSFDGGQTWTPNQRVSEVSSSPFNAFASDKSVPVQPYDRNAPISLMSPQAGLIGEYIGLATSRLRATTVFTDTRNGNQDVYAANMPLRLFPPHPIGPADGLAVYGADILFEWDDYSFYDADLTYTLEYSTDPDFVSDVVRANDLTAHTENVTLPGPGVYYWRVRATDPLGDSSAFSTPNAFEYILDCWCECHGDPAGCDGVVDVLDVVSIVGVAFRGAPDILDPSGLCPYTTTDLDCSGYTNVIDVVKIVNVAFRGGTVETEFCDPCAPGTFFGYDPPGSEAVTFAADILTAEKHPHGSLTFARDLTEIWWSAFLGTDWDETIYYSTFDGDSLTTPSIAPFAALDEYDHGPSFTDNGERIYFSATRPVPGRYVDPVAAVWYVERVGPGWSVPMVVDSTVDPDRTGGEVSMSRNGNIYFAGRYLSEPMPILFCSKLVDGEYKTPQPLTGDITAVGNMVDPYVDPAERFILFSVFNAPGGYGITDIYISYRQPDDTWGQAINLGASVNTEYFERFPSLSRDGRYLFFVRNIGAEFPSEDSHYYWMSTPF